MDPPRIRLRTSKADLKELHDAVAKLQNWGFDIKKDGSQSTFNLYFKPGCETLPELEFFLACLEVMDQVITPNGFHPLEEGKTDERVYVQNQPVSVAFKPILKDSG